MGIKRKENVTINMENDEKALKKMVETLKTQMVEQGQHEMPKAYVDYCNKALNSAMKKVFEKWLMKK